MSSPAERSKNNTIRGAEYVFTGMRMLMHPHLRKFVVVPLLINCVIFAGLTGLVAYYIDGLTASDWHFPEVLKFLEATLKWLAWFFIVVIVIMVYGYVFNIITTILAAPFYGLLAQRTEELITGVAVHDEPLVKLIPRTILREVSKLIYFLTRGLLLVLLLLLLGTLPLLNLSVPIIGALWSAWCMALQYADYSADNHQTEFAFLRKKLRHCKYSSVGFGGTVMACSMVPLLNIIVMPAAVIGGTRYWVEELAQLEKATN